MASKDSTSNKLFSNYKASKLGGYYRNGGESSRYVVGSVGKSSGKRIKFSPETMRSNQNVAIATQVLNPSAIGGPFKNRGFGEHFGPKEDDQISFLSHKSRALCSKVFFYGVSIGAMVLMVSGENLSIFHFFFIFIHWNVITFNDCKISIFPKVS